MNIRNTLKNNWRYALYVVGTIVLFLIVLEYSLQKIYHLGTPLIHEFNNPLYGTRPLPNQSLVRFTGAQININNKGFRTNDHWDDNINNKILVIGDSVTYGGSYIDNSKLFTALIQNQLPGYQVGNAGVNGWGAKNMAGLVVDAKINPAKVYITVILDFSNFYRGLSTNYGWSQKPKGALHEVSRHYWWLYRSKIINFFTPELTIMEKKEQNIQRIEHLKQNVHSLKKMDTYLKKQGYQHLIFITPTKRQITHDQAIDPLAYNELITNNINVIYLVHDLVEIGVREYQSDINELFVDHCHLSQKGHQVWATIMLRYIKQHLSL